MGGRGWGVVVGAAMIAAVPEARAESPTYFVLGVGYQSMAGSAAAAADRDPGWNFYGGIRRRVNERFIVGVSGQYSSNDLNEREFLESREIFTSAPENFVAGGDLQVVGVTGDILWEYPIERSTVGFVKAGAGYFQWTVDDILVNTEPFNLPEEDGRIVFADETSFGGYVGAGLRFPLGDNAGLWGDVTVHLLGGEGGGMQLIPLRVGISLP